MLLFSSLFCLSYNPQCVSIAGASLTSRVIDVVILPFFLLSLDELLNSLNHREPLEVDGGGWSYPYPVRDP